MTAILEVHELTAGYGAGAVLHGLSFDVAQGGVTALLGANGAGKTTTLQSLSGLLRRSGSVRFAGTETVGLKPDRIARLGIAHVPQGRGTFAGLTVEENLRLGAISRGDRRGLAADIEGVYARFPVLGKRRAQQAGTLSGGEQQMLAVGRALMLRPTLLLLDEPSFGLAPMIVEFLFETLATLKRETGIAILIVEQNAELALELADDAFLIEAGQIVFSGAAGALKQDEALRHAYLGY